MCKLPSVGMNWSYLWERHLCLLQGCTDSHGMSLPVLGKAPIQFSVVCCQNSCTGITGGSWGDPRKDGFTTQYLQILAGLGFLT